MSERIPLSYTFDQQRQEINEIANELGDITQLASGLPSVVAAINSLQAGSADGGEFLNGPAAPTAGDGANGDFWLDTSTNDLYGPKENGAWPADTISFSEQILSGVVAPLSTLGKVNDYYFDSAKKELYGPKTSSGWGTPTPLGEADYQNVLYVKPNGSDSNTGASPSKAFQTIKAAAKAAAATDGNTTIRVATGKYVEDNPIYLPNGTSIVGDNLRETIVIPQNEGRDLFWITSGCYVNYMVFEDNFSGGLGYLETEQVDNRVLSPGDQVFRVLPGHTLTRNDVVFGDAANQVEFKKTDLIASAIADMLTQFPAIVNNPDYDQTTCERDLGLIADAIIADLRAGGNVKSIQAGLSYRTPSATRFYTPTNATYDPATGVAVLTIPNHGLTNGDYIKFAPGSLVFTCATDNNQSQHAYPRSGDGNYNVFMEITASDATTVTVNAGISSDTSAHTFVSAAQDAVITQKTIYGGELISEIDQEEIEQIFAIERLSYHAQQELLNNPSSDPGWTYPAIIQDTSGYPACARAQAFISTAESIITSIMQGGDVPQYHVGPGFILVDQEWMQVLDFDTTTNTFTVTRGVNNPITGEPTTDDKHITGAFVSQSGFTWRYAVAYPDQNGYQGKGRVTLTANNAVVSGDASTVFTEELSAGWKIKVGGVEYEIASVDNNGQLTLVNPTPSGVSHTLDIWYVIPPKERIFLSPYTQNCSCISKLGRAVYDSNLGEYDTTKTRGGGLLADGDQLNSNSPLESMVVDAFTQIVFGSIGFHLKNDAYAQLVSIFQVFESVGVLAESGGYASITNSATNFGFEGLKAVGFSENVLPIFAGGQVSSVQNITKTDINTAPSDIVGTVFSSETGGTATRATIEVSIVDIGKFERGQTVTISNHISTPDINGTGKVIDTVDFQNNKISIVEQVAYDAATFVDGGTTGEIEIASGSVFTKINVTGYQAPPIPNYVLKIPGLGLDPTGNEQVVGEVLSYDAGNFTEFTTNFPLTDAQVNSIGNNASAQLFAPSTVNSSSHTFEYVGTGINYTAFPQNGGITDAAKQNVEVNSGKTYVSATDQSGNFSVGPFFNVNLRSGKVTFNGSVALGVLDSLQLKGSPGVPIFEFSPDNELGGAVGRSDTVLPTQKAVRDYINKSSVLGNFVGLNKGTSSIPGLVVQLDATGKIDSSQIPQTSTFVVYTVETEAERLQDYIPVATKTVDSNTTTAPYLITLDEADLTDLSDGLVVVGTNIPTNTRIVQNGIDVVNKTIEVDQAIPALTSGATLSFLGDPLKAGDIVIQKNEADGDPLTLLQTWILTALPGTDANNWELIALNQLDAAAIVSGLISPSRLGTGVANDDTYLNGLNKFTPVVKGILPPSNSAITVVGTAETLKKTGTPLTVSGITWTSDTATLTTASAHLLTTGDYVEVEQVIPDTFNGVYEVTVTSTTEFTYDRVGSPGSYISGGLVTAGELNESGFVELDVNAAGYTTGQNSGSSNLGVASFLYDRFTIDTQNVVDIRDKSITLGKMQNIAPKTLLGNNGTLASNPQEIEIGVGVAGVPTFQISISANRYQVFDENVSKSYGTTPDLQLVAGKEYVFRLDNVTGHPFYIVSSPGAIGANLYSDGVVGNGSGNVGDLVRFTVPQDSPQFLYYQSGGDAANFGIIKIVKIGDNLEVVDSTSANSLIVDEFGVASDINTVEYLIQMKNSQNPYFHSTKILVLHDGTDVYLTEYASIFNDRSLGSFTAEIVSGQVRLVYQPATNQNDYLNRLTIQKNYVLS
tara:strand:+ start:7854 stop:13130 length:5277 start_codon:yes stop_codon:yes gene_type:complete